ncbi:pyrroline-5-carboxylate reductase ProI [Metabacillus iocasae]|uniref:Pyrroline-5-carboxylate reductase n=1 Tax=Priestia iocasae TaxID=2291674 RepID=A0ABS2QQB6_9BACI|nr:pyrroline-5-carboxylate reductase ProI [Metabacillus iocasae]MBM7701631.1 pyrroline-5-carboxylate reductase [Metabacillus iocasae]
MNGISSIGFIGAGSMAEAMVAGLVEKKQLRKQNIYVTNHSNDARLNYFKSTYGVNVTRDKQEIVTNCDLIVLAMKPKDVVEGVQSIKPFIKDKQFIVSVLAGVSTESIQTLIEKEVAVVRAMPNTSASIGLSATAIAKGEFATTYHIKESKQLFSSIGTVTIVKEDDLHAVTGLSGSGPAYVYYLVEAMEAAAHTIGLNQETAKDLILQTLIGSAEMLKHSSKSPATLRKEVTSPGGTTEAGLKTLSAYRYQEAMIECIKQATERSKELGESINQTTMSPKL